VQAKSGSATLSGTIWGQFVERVERPLTLRDGVAPHEIMKRIQALAKKALNVVRSGDDLREALEDIRDIRVQYLPRLSASSTERPYNRGWIDAIEVRSAALTVEAIALSALERRESRGAHFRTDYPTKDERLLVNSAVSSLDGAPAHRLLPVSRKTTDDHATAETAA
jgi:succinate dehydrogenase/fumarate reductase flavoprotein subunit